MRSLLRRGRPSIPSEPVPDPADTAVLTRFLTLGGATVELRSHRFTTTYTVQGRPFVSDHARTVDGYVWECLGCGADGKGILDWDGRYLPDERAQAREHANTHAGACRAMPAPNGGGR
jgi:hypothetical protein